MGNPDNIPYASPFYTLLHCLVSYSQAPCSCKYVLFC